MICENCKQEFNGKFCPFCGMKANDNKCPVCGNELPEGAKFCNECGCNILDEKERRAAAGQADFAKAKEKGNEAQADNSGAEPLTDSMQSEKVLSDNNTSADSKPCESKTCKECSSN